MNYLSPREIIKNGKEVLSAVTWSSNATRNQNVDNLSRINLNFPANNSRFLFYEDLRDATGRRRVHNFCRKFTAQFFEYVHLHTKIHGYLT